MRFLCSSAFLYSVAALAVCTYKMAYCCPYRRKKMNAMDEKVMFRIPGDELAAFKRRVAEDGLTVSVFLRIA